MEDSTNETSYLPSEVYPSIDELLTETLRGRIPASLADEISERYLTLGGKYVTEHQHTDGRYINGMMFTDRIQNCLEEVVDAVFCMIGWIFKANEANVGKWSNDQTPIPDSAFVAFDTLCDVYTLLHSEKMAGTPS